VARLEEGERGACVSFGRSDTVESVWCAQQYLFLILKRGKMDGPGDHANSAIEEATKTYVELVAVVRIVRKVLELCLRRFHRHVGFDVAGEDDVEDWLGRWIGLRSAARPCSPSWRSRGEAFKFVICSYQSIIVRRWTRCCKK
jgi:hypothetical protein